MAISTSLGDAKAPLLALAKMPVKSRSSTTLVFCALSRPARWSFADLIACVRRDGTGRAQ
jgi:hypothetical protein